MSEKSKKGDFMADFAEPQVPDGLCQKCEKCGEIICSNTTSGRAESAGMAFDRGKLL